MTRPNLKPKVRTKRYMYTQLGKLQPEQLLELQSKLADAAIALELGGAWRPIFHNARYSHPQAGYMYRLYTKLSKSEYQHAKGLAAALLDDPMFNTDLQSIAK